MQPEPLPRPAASHSRHARRQTRVVLVSDRPAGHHPLDEGFEVVRVPFDRAEAELTVRPADVIVVDARDAVRLGEVATLALGGTRGVVVVGPPNDPTEAMRYLDLGASDYVSYRATPAELTARVRAVARSTVSDQDDDTLVLADVSISLRRREVRKRGELVRLTPNEFAVLEVLAEDPGALVTHHELMVRVWGPEYADSRHYLRLYIRQIREKLEDDPATPRVVLTEWGTGYRLGDVDEGINRQRFASA